MGSGSAWMLARAGAKVVVLERSVPGAEASSAAAGILGAHAEAHRPGPMADLLLAGLGRHADWASELARETGIDVEFRRSGVLSTRPTRKEASRLVKEVAWMRSPRRVRPVDGGAVRKLEPALAPTAGGVLFSDDARVDPKRLFRAVHIAAQAAGARFETGAYVERVLVENGRAAGVAVEGGQEYRAPVVVVAAGSWSTLVRGTPLAPRTVIPARGQILELEARAPLLSHVVFGGRCYLVPRDDGRILVGSTLEFVGYRREVTAGGMRDLLDAAIELLPALAESRVSASWSNFRPYTTDELPLLGRTRVPGLLLATGHYRNGILLAPITAEIVASLALGKTPAVDVSPFEAARLGT
jgi:glycine oxidase